MANLGDLLERLLIRHHDLLRQARLDTTERDPDPLPADAMTPNASNPQPPVASAFSKKDQDRQQRMARREARYQEMHALHQQGSGIRAIARVLGIHPETARKILAATSCPHPGPRPHRRRRITPFIPSLRDRWEAGDGVHLRCRRSSSRRSIWYSK